MVQISELVPTAVLAVSPQSRRTYARAMRLLDRELGARDLHDVTLADLQRLRDRVQREAGARTVSRARRQGRRLRSYDPDAFGKGAAENFVSGTRFFFRYARSAGLLEVSPAAELTSPRRPPNPERPLEEDELAQIWWVATSTGLDRELDRQLLTFLRHTACRREGCLNLMLDHLDLRRGSVTLTEKYGQSRELPLSRRVITDLTAFAQLRGARDPGDAVFRYRSGTALTRRRFNSLFDRIDRHLSWTEPLDVGAHWIRHTTLADIAAVSDLRVAAAYAGHSPGSMGVIGRYTKVTFTDLAQAYEVVFGPRG